jgi:hypothetical protein
LPEPGREHKLFIEQRVLILAQLFDRALGAFGTIAADATVANVFERKRGNLTGAKTVSVPE